MTHIKPGTLYIVATPIGNLKDITLRAIEILKEVDLIACEDTRHSKKLLDHYGIKKSLVALHEHNEEKKVATILHKLNEGQNIALISDAGTPLISDPGYKLVAKLREEKIDVVPLPGPSALITALSAAGLPSNEFHFIGFLPVKKSAKETILQNLLQDSSTLIFYEAPHRLINTIDTIRNTFPKERRIVVAKELTKMFETFYYATLDNIKEQLSEKKPQGEFVILLEGAKDNKSKSADLNSEKILQLLLDELPTKQAASLTAKIVNANKNELYKKALELKDKD